MITSTGAIVEQYHGTSLPDSWDWYVNSTLRHQFSKLSLSPSFYLPAPPSEAEEGYTHSLLFASHTSRLLLGKKLRGFAKGSFNGVGGKVLTSETAAESIVRETEEETGLSLRAEEVQFVGRVKVDVEGGEKVVIAVFRADLTAEQRDQMSSSEEVEAGWYHFTSTNLDRLPWDRMRPEHRLYLGPLLQSCLDQEKLVLDLDIHFHPEPRAEELDPYERTENHRIVRQWELRIHRPSAHTHTRDEIEHDPDTSGSEWDYGDYTRNAF